MRKRGAKVGYPVLDTSVITGTAFILGLSSGLSTSLVHTLSISLVKGLLC